MGAATWSGGGWVYPFGRYGYLATFINPPVKHVAIDYYTSYAVWSRFDGSIVTEAPLIR